MIILTLLKMMVMKARKTMDMVKYYRIIHCISMIIKNVYSALDIEYWLRRKIYDKTFQVDQGTLGQVLLQKRDWADIGISLWDYKV